MQTNTLLITASIVPHTTLSTMATNKHTKKVFLAEGPTGDIIIASGMHTTTSMKIIQGRATITIIDRAIYPSNEAAGASCPCPPITLKVTLSNPVARSNKPISIFDLCMNAR